MSSISQGHSLWSSLRNLTVVVVTGGVVDVSDGSTFVVAIGLSLEAEIKSADVVTSTAAVVTSSAIVAITSSAVVVTTISVVVTSTVSVETSTEVVVSTTSGIIAVVVTPSVVVSASVATTESVVATESVMTSLLVLTSLLVVMSLSVVTSVEAVVLSVLLTSRLADSNDISFNAVKIDSSAFVKASVTLLSISSFV